MPAPGVRVPVPASVSVEVGDPFIVMLVVGLETVDWTVPLFVNVPPFTFNVSAVLAISATDVLLELSRVMLLPPKDIVEAAAPVFKLSVLVPPPVLKVKF